MRPNTITAHFLALCTLLSVEASKTSDIVRNPFALMNLMRVNTKLDNAKYNPDINLNTLQMIRKAGYPAEAHVVLTEDGFLLTLHRIPGSKNSPPVLLQHGLLCSSADWVILGKDKGLAYMLADQGYDIWLGNFRGNTYSRAHISLSPSDAKFWDFSFHEMGMYDLPEMISFIMNKTSQPLHTYIAHSMGNSAFYVMATNRPDITEKIGATISLAPAIFVQHMKSPLHYFASLSYFIEDIKTLYNSLPNVQDIYRVPFSKFNHIDFVWAKDAPTLVYDKVLLR